MKRVSAGILLLSLVLSACAKENDAAAPSPSASGRPPSTGMIAFVSPTPGASVPADDVVVEISLTGATLAKQASTNITPDEGHMHLALDGRTITLLAGLKITINDLPDVNGPIAKGTHILEAEFAASDHGSFNPRVTKTVTFKAV